MGSASQPKQLEKIMTTTYTGTASQKAKIRERAMLGTTAEKARVTASGEVHLYGTMPNTNHEGWYFAGWAEEIFIGIGRFNSHC